MRRIAEPLREARPHADRLSSNKSIGQLVRRPRGEPRRTAMRPPGILPTGCWAVRPVGAPDAERGTTGTITVSPTFIGLARNNGKPQCLPRQAFQLTAIIVAHGGRAAGRRLLCKTCAARYQCKRASRLRRGGASVTPQGVANRGRSPTIAGRRKRAEKLTHGRRPVARRVETAVPAGFRAQRAAGGPLPKPAGGA